MVYLNRLLSALGFLALVALFFAFNVFIGLYLISLLLVPVTWLYAAATGRSYSFVVDQSAMLYQLNKFGQWAWLATACAAVAYLTIWKNF